MIKMRKLYISIIWIGWLGIACNGNIIYGKPGGLMETPAAPASSAATPSQQQSNNADELLKGAESTNYGPYGAHAYGGHGHGHHHGGGDLAVVVTGGYKVSDSPHQHGGHQGFGGYHYGGQFQSPQGQGIEWAQGTPIEHGVPIVNHAQGHHGYHSHPQVHGPIHEPIKHNELGAGLYSHQPAIYKSHGYGHHIPSHGLIGHGYGHGLQGGYHQHFGHAHGGFKPIIAHGYGLGHHHQGYGQGHHHLQGHSQHQLHGHGHHQLHGTGHHGYGVYPGNLGVGRGVGYGLSNGLGHGVGHGQGILGHGGYAG